MKEKENLHKESRRHQNVHENLKSSTNSILENSAKNRMSIDSNSLHDLDIKYLTNTRQKVQNRKNVMDLKNQMSPVYYNRDAERFSYLEYQDPLIGNSFQSIPQQQQQHVDQYGQGYYLNNKYANRIPQQQQQNYRNYPYDNSMSYQYNQNQRKDISTLNNQMKNQFNGVNSTSRNQGQSDNSSLMSKSSEYITERREDSFGNIDVIRRRVSPQTQYQNTTPNLPQPTKSQPTDPDLQRYTRNAPISTAQQPDNNGRNLFGGENRLLPKINISLVVFIVLAIYVISKNIVKYMNDDGNYFTNIGSSFSQTFKIFSNQSKKQSPTTPSNINNSHSRQYYKEVYLNDGVRINPDENTNRIESANQQLNPNMDSHLAKKFAQDLINELTTILKQKGKVYRSDYEDNLSNRFQTPLLREILPELNKLLLNSKFIRIEYDVIRRQEFYELYPTQ